MTGGRVECVAGRPRPSSAVVPNAPPSHTAEAPQGPLLRARAHGAAEDRTEWEELAGGGVVKWAE